MNSANIKLSVLAGLQKDWGVFNLNAANAYNNILVEIFTSGKTYVESEECSMIHAGESGYKEFEGVNPINDSNWDLTPLGDKLKGLLRPYFMSESDNLRASALQELYDEVTSYQSYKNLFSVEFTGSTTLITTTKGQYYDYQGNIVNLIETSTDDNEQQVTSAHTSIKRSLAALKGTADEEFLYLQVKIINYSKYYNIYAKDSTVLTPVLRPLLYTQDDLDTYGLGLDETKKIPYVKYIWRAGFYYGGRASRSEDNYIDHWIHAYDPNQGYYDVSTTIYHIDDNYGGTRDLSLFNTNLGNYVTFWRGHKEWWDSIPKGFLLFGMNDESRTTETFNRNDNMDTGQRELLHQASYTNIFQMKNYMLDFYTKYVNCDTGDTPLLALAYNGDSSENIHIFNTWFPVKSKSADHPTQEISYKSGMEEKYPKYIGIVAASVLANVYIYSESVGDSISYIPDVIYLTNHYTTYTKDMIYMAQVREDFNDTQSALVLFNKCVLSDYIETIKRRRNHVPGEEITASDNNVKLEIKACIKNIPLLFKLGYIQPNLDLVGVKSGRAKVRYIDGTEQDIILKDNSKGKLYQVEPGKDVATANELGSNFKIRYLKSLERAPSGNGLVAEFDTSLLEEKNEWLYRTFKWDETELGFVSTEHMQSGYSYSITTDYHKDVCLHHLPKKEVIAPFAKLF